MKVLNFLRLTDEQGRISLSNLAIYLMLGKVLVTPQLALPDVGAFLAALASYQMKRFMNNERPDEAADMQALKEQLGKLQSSVVAVQMANGMKPRQ